MLDGAVCDVDHSLGVSTVDWFICAYSGGLWGNGKQQSHDEWIDEEFDPASALDRANEDDSYIIKPGQILTIKADADKDTLRFWIDGKPHGNPDYTSGVKGRLRFAINVTRRGNSAQIVPTLEIQYK